MGEEEAEQKEEVRKGEQKLRCKWRGRRNFEVKKGKKKERGWWGDGEKKLEEKRIRRMKK